MKILFWNVQRVGGTTSEQRNLMFESVIAQFIRDGGDMILLCEVTSDFVLSGNQFEKVGVRPRRTDSLTRQQLGYAAFDRDLNNIPIQIEDITRFSVNFEDRITFRGGDSFSNQSNRYVIKIGDENIFLYHSNASYKSQVLVPWVANHLSNSYSQFVLIGDLNVNPDEWRYEIPNTESVFAGPTHGVSNTYDYAVFRSGLNATVAKMDSRKFAIEAGISHSDHLPIIVEVR
jgi:hypothetical protein